MDPPFEMSLPHAKRVKQLDSTGVEDQPVDSDLWELHALVQRAIQDRAAVLAGQDEEDGEPAAAAAAKQPALPNPQRVLEKLFTARGEVDVILDLVGFVEAQQFVGVAHLPRKASTLEDLTRGRALRLAHRQAQLQACSARLAGGLEALQAQAEVAGRFLRAVAELRKRWRLKRHPGKDGLFYIDLALPLTANARRVVGEQPGSQWNLLQDTNGDVCMVDKGPSGRPFAVRGWERIHAALQSKARMLTWHAVRQLVAHEAEAAQQAQQQGGASADPDGLSAVVLQLAEAARECAAREQSEQSAQQQQQEGAAGEGGGGGAGDDSGLADMHVDHDTAAAGPDLAAAAARAGAGASAGGYGGGGKAAAAAGAAPVGLSAGALTSMQSAAAADVQALLGTPGFQQQFSARALRLLRGYLRGAPSSAGPPEGATEAGAGMGGGWSGGGSGGGSGSGSGALPRPELLPQLLAWLRHRAACHRVEASLRRQVEGWNQRQQGQQGGGGSQAAVGPVSLQWVPSGAELVDVWQLSTEAGPAAPGLQLPPALVIVCEGVVRLEGSLARQADAQAGGACRVLARGEVDCILEYALRP